MLPDIAELVFGAPGGRRRWLDWGTFHVKPDYLGLLRSYVRVLRQRNSALRRQAPALEPWTRQLLVLADSVTRERESYLERIVPRFRTTLARLAPELDVRLDYRRGWPNGQSLEKTLGDSHAREVKLGATQWGPHRADVLVRNGESAAAAVLSRGQAKMVAIALQISQAGLLADLEQRTTVFLIDDVGAELDLAHSRRFFELLEELDCQILATAARRPNLEDSEFAVFESIPSAARRSRRARLFHVEHGQVRGE